MFSNRAVRYPQENNPNWPLSPDWHQLTEDGKRQCRLAVIRNRVTPEDDVISWTVFRDHYLCWEDSGWYDQWVEPAPGHYEWVYNCAAYDRLMMGAHRGSAKSTIFKELTLRDAVSTPYLLPRGWNRFSSTLCVYSTDSFVEDNFDQFMYQIESNSRIIEDFGELKPSRGSAGLWNHHQIILRNRSEIRGVSAESKTIRGKRPQRVLIDDIEYDPREGTNIDKLIENAYTLIFQVVVPMLRKGSKLNMIGTPIKRRMFLYRMIEGEETAKQLDVKRWFLRMYPGVAPEYDFDNPKEELIFWPAENNPDDIAAKKREWKNFDAEFLCSPGQEAEKNLLLDPSLNYYHVNGSPELEPAPLYSPCEVSYMEAVREKGVISHMPVRKKFCDAMAPMTRFITVDPSRKLGTHNDYSVIQVFGIDKHDQLFSLDGWVGRLQYIPLTRKVWQYALKWRVHTIGCESESLELMMMQHLRDTAPIFAREHGWRPRLVPVLYSRGKLRKVVGKRMQTDRLDKSTRIAALEPRFTAGLFKVPDGRLSEPLYQQLLSQIGMFDGDVDNLPHDDVLDSVAMAQFMLHGKATKPPVETDQKSEVIERLRSGKRTTEEGLPLAACVDFCSITDADLERVIEGKAVGHQLKRPEGDRRKWTMFLV